MYLMAIATDHIWCIDFPGERNAHLLLAEVEQRLGSQDIIDGAPPYGNGPPGAMADVVPCLPCPSRSITRTVISGRPLALELWPLGGEAVDGRGHAPGSCDGLEEDGREPVACAGERSYWFPWHLGVRSGRRRKLSFDFFSSPFPCCVDREEEKEDEPSILFCAAETLV
ncbi:hypothetical protein GW17_00058271 [Ensete ventricosum]|nr:hypothetical protein GW17_00058271 [Ensete ventricosum]RZR76125.1 hypothetical protein BHM03_00000748 [Ensete ventricosum]